MRHKTIYREGHRELEWRVVRLGQTLIIVGSAFNPINIFALSAVRQETIDLLTLRKKSHYKMKWLTETGHGCLKMFGHLSRYVLCSAKIWYNSLHEASFT